MLYRKIVCLEDLVVVFVGAMVVGQAVLLALYPRSIGATALTALQMAMFHSGHLIVAGALIIDAVLAVFGILFVKRNVHLAFLIPLWSVLAVMAGAGVGAAWLGHYLDGTPIPWEHIAADQAPYPVLFLVYTATMVLSFKRR